MRFSFKVESEEDLSRQIVKSDACIFRIEDIDLEIPAGRGQLTNVEGILLMVQKDLSCQQEERKAVDFELYEKINDFIQKLSQMTAYKLFPFTVSLDDPTGNSWVEPNTADGARKRMKHDYARTSEQNTALGLSATDEDPSESIKVRSEYRAHQMHPPRDEQMAADDVDDGDEIIENKVYTFTDKCSSCGRGCETNMKMVNIPYFREVVLMSTLCDHCGCKIGIEVPSIM